MKVLLAGASGNLGGEILKVLCNKGYEVVAADLKERAIEGTEGKYTFVSIDATNPDDLTISQLKGKKAIFRQLMYYRKHFPGFENAYIAEIAAMVGIRESREIETEYVMSAVDLYSQKKFDDMFCQSNYPIDVHGKAHNCSFDGIEKDEARPWYDIPYRSIVV